MKKLSRADKVSAEMKGEIAMKKIKGTGYNPIKNLSHWAHPKGATRPAGMAKLVKVAKASKPKKGY